MTKKPSLAVTFRTDPDLWKRYRIACLEAGTNASAQLKALIRAWVDAQEKPANIIEPDAR